MCIIVRCDLHIIYLLFIFIFFFRFKIQQNILEFVFQSDLKNILRNKRYWKIVFIGSILQNYNTRVVNTLYIHTLILIISYKNHLTNRIIQNHAANVITRRIIHINSTLSSKLSIRFQKKKKSCPNLTICHCITLSALPPSVRYTLSREMKLSDR